MGLEDAGGLERRAGVDGARGVEEDGGAQSRFQGEIVVEVGIIGGQRGSWCRVCGGGVEGGDGTADDTALGDDGAGVDYQRAVGGDEARARVDEDMGREGDGMGA